MPDPVDARILEQQHAAPQPLLDLGLGHARRHQRAAPHQPERPARLPADFPIRFLVWTSHHEV
jgi:hypothetical protein